MDPREFDSLCVFLKAASGLIVTPDKEYLVETRLKPVAQLLGLNDVSSLVARLRTAPTEALKQSVVEAMTTNETSFFRDARPFELFQNFVLDELMDRRRARKELRIWCAASSTGQEPYSLAMLLKEQATKLAGWRVEIIATDIDQQVLKKADRGVYSEFEVQRGLPARHLVKYFTKRPEGDWQLSDSVRAMVKYRQQNLLAPFTALGTFDLVMCRNVLIYFDAPTKGEILRRAVQVMQPDGYLMLGGAETVFGVSDRLSPVPGQRSLYAQAGSIALQAKSTPQLRVAAA